MTDYDYLSAKLGKKGALSLVEDFSFTDRPSIRKIGRSLDIAAHILQQHPDQLWEQLFNRMWRESAPAIERLLDYRVRRPWLKSSSDNFVKPDAALIRTMDYQNEPVAGVILWDADTVVTGTEDGAVFYFATDSGQLKHCFKAHQAEIVSLLKSPIGLITTADDGSIGVWSVDDRRCLFAKKIHGGSTTHAVVSPSGRYLITCGEDGRCCLVHLGNWACITLVRNQKSRFAAEAISYCERFLALAARDGTIAFLHLPGGERIGRTKPMPSAVHRLVFDISAESVFAGDKSGNVGAVGVADNRSPKVLYTHEDGICQLKVHLPTRTLFSASEEGEIIRWDIQRHEKTAACSGHYGPITAVCFLPEGNRFYSAGWDRSVRAWNMKSGEQVGLYRGHSDEISDMDMDGQKGIIVSGSWDGTLRLWNINGDIPIDREAHHDEISFIKFSPDFSKIVSASNDGLLKIRDADSLESLHTLEGHAHWVTHFDFYDGKHILSASDDHTVRFWELAGGRCLKILSGHEDDVIGVHPVQALPGTAVSYSLDGSMILWDLEVGEIITRFCEHTDGIWDLAVHPEKPLAVSVSSDKTVKVWNLCRSASRFTLTGHEKAVAAIAICPDAMRAVSGDDRGGIFMWDIDSGAPIRKLLCHREDIHQILVTADEKYCIASSDDHHISAWEVDTGKRISRFSAHSNPGLTDQIQLTANDRWLVSCSDDGGLNVWNWRKGTAIAAFHADVGIGAIDTIPDGRRIAAGDAAGRLHLFVLEGI